MQPTLYEGDLALVRSQSTYEPGDIIAFRVPEGDDGAGTLVIHRIVSGDGGSGFTVQGDNKRSADRWHPQQGDVLGSTWFHVDGAGAWFAKLYEPLGRIALVGIVATFLLIGNGTKDPTRRLLRGRPSSPSTTLLIVAAPGRK